MIKVCNISKKFGHVEVLHDLNFSLQRGDIVGLLGINGAGKTTTMNIIAGILKPDNGKVLVDDEDISINSKKIKRKIGYLHESNPLYEDMYVREYLEYIAKIYSTKKPIEQVENVIENVGLKNELKKKIHTLSKGNKQRVGLAQALIHNPEILILDEPTSGFDPNQQSQIKELLLKLRESKTIIFSTHHLEEVSDIATHFIILNKGTIVFDGKKDNNTSIKELFYNLTK